jgi:hypothetical protein
MRIAIISAGFWLRPRPGCGILIPVFPARPLSGFNALFFLALANAGTLACLCLLCASLASAAPGHHRRAKSRACDSHARLTLRALTGQRPLGPVSGPSTRAQAGLIDPMLLLQRGHGAIFDDEVAVISNDAPVAQIDADVSLVPAFEALGVLARTVDQLPSSDVFSPRSPRGPPYSA